MPDERYEAIGFQDCGSLLLAYQGEVIEIAKHLAVQEPALRSFLETMVHELEQDRMRLPRLPVTVTRVLDLAADPDTEVADLVATVELDATLAAKVVGIANSSAFRGVGGPVSSVDEALMRIGTRRAFDIVMMAALRSELIPEGVLSERAEDLWRRSLRCALVCQYLLDEVPPWQRSGFLLGLLHAMGQWAILGFATTLSQRGWTDRSLGPEVLDPVADALEGPLGGLVVESWEYPEPFTQAVRHCRQPERCTGEGIALGRAISLACKFSERFAEDEIPDFEEIEADVEADLKALGIERKRFVEIAEAAFAAFDVLGELG